MLIDAIQKAKRTITAPMIIQCKVSSLNFICLKSRDSFASLKDFIDFFCVTLRVVARFAGARFAVDLFVLVADFFVAIQLVYSLRLKCTGGMIRGNAK